MITELYNNIFYSIWTFWGTLMLLFMVFLISAGIFRR